MENIQTDTHTLAQMWIYGERLVSLDQCHQPARQDHLTKIHVIRYADDFIVTAETLEIFEERVEPAVAAFLQAHGLTLSEEKIHITHIDTGFKFLGFNIRKDQQPLVSLRLYCLNKSLSTKSINYGLGYYK